MNSLAIIAALAALELWFLTIVCARPSDDVENPEKQESAAKNGISKTENSDPSGAATPTMHRGWHAQESSHRQHERQYWKLSLVIGGLTMAGAMAAAVAAFFAYEQTRRQADAASQEADAASREADAASRQANDADAALPRAWLYVEFTKPGPDKYITPPAVLNDGTRSFSVNLSFGLRNFGQSPATVNSVTAMLYAPRTADYMSIVPIEPDGTINPNLAASPGDGVRSDGRPNDVIEFSSQLIAPGADYMDPAKTSFIFYHQPNVDWLPSGFDYWIRIVVHYSDPYGPNRITSYFGKVGAGSPIAINDSKYTYEK